VSTRSRCLGGAAAATARWGVEPPHHRTRGGCRGTSIRKAPSRRASRGRHDAARGRLCGRSHDPRMYPPARRGVMPLDRDVLTTGEVAKLCNVAPRTVSKWFDSGQLKGYRIPGSKDRRIPVSELVRFMKGPRHPAGRRAERLQPASSSSTTTRRVVDTSSRNVLSEQTEYEVQTATGRFAGGPALRAAPPARRALNVHLDGADGSDIAQTHPRLGLHPDHPRHRA
jgi:excisionase family DNA binding protein